MAESTISRLLKGHQWRKVRPRPRHPCSDPAEQAAWKAAFADQVAAAVATRAPDDLREVVVMAQDDSLIVPRANTDMMNLFLAHVAEEFAD